MTVAIVCAAATLAGEGMVRMIGAVGTYLFGIALAVAAVLTM